MLVSFSVIFSTASECFPGVSDRDGPVAACTTRTKAYISFAAAQRCRYEYETIMTNLVVEGGSGDYVRT